MGVGTEVEGEGDLLYQWLHCHHKHDSCIKMGSDESHFNVSLTHNCEGQRHKTLFTEEKGELKLIQTEVPLLTR